MGKKLAIRGHSARGKEVIELLEMMGGKNIHKHDGGSNSYSYYLFDYAILHDRLSIAEDDDFEIFTLEEFLGKFPYKVCDKVHIYVQNDDTDGRYDMEVAEISSMRWNPERRKIAYKMKGINREFYKEEIKCKVDDDSNKMNDCKKCGLHFGSVRCFDKDCPNNTPKNLEETQSNQDIDKVVFRKEFCERCGSQRCSGQDDELEYCERFKNLMDNSGKPSDKNHKMGPKSKLPSKYYEDKMEEIKSNQEYDELRIPLDDNENKFPSFEPMFKMNDELEYKIPDGYEITEVSKDKVFIKKIKSKYPKTYEECVRIAKNIHGYDIHVDVPAYGELMESFVKLLICRDAYWKMAGEELGLGKPWEPQFGKCVLFDISFYFYQGNFVLHKGEYNSSDNCILVFPTEEMRDVFHENFKDLIEQCKELL